MFLSRTPAVSPTRTKLPQNVLSNILCKDYIIGQVSFLSRWCTGKKWEARIWHKLLLDYFEVYDFMWIKWDILIEWIEIIDGKSAVFELSWKRLRGWEPSWVDMWALFARIIQILNYSLRKQKKSENIQMNSKLATNRTSSGRCLISFHVQQTLLNSDIGEWIAESKPVIFWKFKIAAAPDRRVVHVFAEHDFSINHCKQRRGGLLNGAPAGDHWAGRGGALVNPGGFEEVSEMAAPVGITEQGEVGPCSLPVRYHGQELSSSLLNSLLQVQLSSFSLIYFYYAIFPKGFLTWNENRKFHLPRWELSNNLYSNGV